MMKFCQSCGKELLDEAVMCPSCGTAFAEREGSPAPSAEKKENFITKLVNEAKKKWSVKNMILLGVAVVVVVGLVVGGLLVYHNIRVANVKEQLAGNTYSFFEVSSYTSSYTDVKFKFDEEAVLEYSYYYSIIDSGGTYTRDYEITFERGMVFLECLTDKYEIQYDRYGNIESLCDVNTGDIYD